MKKINIILLVLLLFSCANNNKKQEDKAKKEVEKQLSKLEQLKQLPKDTILNKMTIRIYT